MRSDDDGTDVRIDVAHGLQGNRRVNRVVYVGINNGE